MKLLKPSFEILEQQSGIDGIYKAIEVAGRTCYKSEDKITEDSAEAFVDRMIKSGHGAMLEHGTVYLHIKYTSPLNDPHYIESSNDSHKYEENKYSIAKRILVNGFEHNVFITTNLRVLVENGWLDDLKYLCEPTEFHEKRVTVRFICDRGVSHEFVRHRVFSFAQESTRYCNYSKDKFGNELTFIIPCWLDINDNTTADSWWSYYKSLSKEDRHLEKNIEIDTFIQMLETFEDFYLKLLGRYDKSKTNFLMRKVWSPQQARAILPNSLKTELIMTGFISDWQHFFELRCAPNAHPQARELAIPLRQEFIKRGYINDGVREENL